MSTTSTTVAAGNAATNTRPKKLYTSRKASSLPVSTVEYLKAWMLSPEHIAHPYPTEQEKAQIMAETGINQKQLTNWFVNNRKRFWKPRVKKAGVTPAIPPSTSTTTTSSTRSSSRLSSPTINQLPIKPERVASSPTSVSKTVNKFCPTQARVSLLNAYVYHQKGEDAHAVSEGSSAGSDDDSVGASTTRSSSSSTTTPFDNKGLSIVSPTKIAHNVSLVNLPAAANDGGYRRNEEVEVHILRPEGSTSSSVEDPLPTIRDLTIKSSVPENRILATFKCPISYTIPKEIEHDKKKVQTRRDGEVLKVKKHYLKLYLATRGIHSVSTPVVTSAEKKVLTTSSSLPSSTLVHSVSEVTLSAAAVSSTNSVVSSSSMPYKKRFSALLTHTTDLIDQDPPRRKRARTSSGSFVEGDEEWKQLCTTADSYFCDSLPSMEEASRMFGYATRD